MKSKTRFLMALSIVVALMLMLLLVGVASAKVWTDQKDYPPGSYVAISGDNSDGAGYLPGETIDVHAVGPNGYSVDCDPPATVDDTGAWLCSVYLPNLDTSVGIWTYTATGETSGVSQSGTFTDAPWPGGTEPCHIPCGTLTDGNIKSLISLMTVTEEDTVAHLGGGNVNGNAGSVAAITRLGIPTWHWTDGPAGVRLSSQETAMPAPVGLTASWDPNMGYLYGQTVALDARATTQDGWYAPMMNQVSVPTAGRNFETLGEDPFLMSQIAVQEVKGAQNNGFVTEIKHYVDNDFENGRTSTSVYVDERTIHEGEMQAFEASVKAGARAVMCAYNRLNIFVTPPALGQGDIYSCSNDYTLNYVLKGREPFVYTQLPVPPAFGFFGNVGSDYGATHRPSDLIYGLDTEQSGSGNLGTPVVTAIGTCSAGNAKPCSGPGTAAIAVSADLPAVPAYTADQWKDALDNAAFYALKMYNDAGYLEGTPYGSMHTAGCMPPSPSGCVAVTPPRSTISALDPSSRAAAQTIAERSATLLKNDGNLLPLNCADFTGGGVLVMGPTAFAPYTGGGGSGHVTPKPNAQSPYDALVAAATAKCGGTPKISYTKGYLPSLTIDGWLVPTHGGSASDSSSNPGLLRTQASSGAVVAPGTAVTPCTPGPGCATPQDDQTVDYSDLNAVLTPGTGWVWQGSVTAPSTDGPWVLRVCYGNNAASATNGAIQLFASTTPFSGAPTSAARVINVTAAYADQSGSSQTTQCHSPGGGKQGSTATGAGTGIASGATRYIELRAISNGASPLRLQLVWAPTTAATFQTESINDAAAMAATANKVLDFIYDDGTEGSDRGNNAIANGLATAGYQDSVVSAINAYNTIVVLNTGDSVFMPWASGTKSILEMWYPGQMGGAATANVLVGNVNPGGKLPETFFDANAPVGQRFPQDTQPAACENNSANYGASGGSVATASNWGQCPMYPGMYFPNNLSNGSTGSLHGYRMINFSDQPLGGVPGNGIFTGYRWFDKNNYTPLFEFGRGLSYAQFEYSNLNVALAGDGLDVSFSVKNTSAVVGDEVPQVYIGAPGTPPVPMAVKALVGFTRITVAPGASQTVTIHVGSRQLSYWSTATHNWALALGARPLYVGSSSRDIRLQTDNATRPTVAIAPDRPADSNGWYNHAVTFTATGTGVAGIGVTCDAPLTYSGPDNAAASVQMSCTDAFGNTGSATVNFKYDATAPTVTVTPDRGPDHNGWYNHAVTFTASGNDGVGFSGVASCDAPSVYSGPDNGSAGPVVLHCTDVAGNTGTGSSGTFQYDATKPHNVVVAADRAPDHNDWYNHGFTATWSGLDDTSGIASCTATPYSTPDTNSGSLSGTCTDVAGNTSDAVAFIFKYDATQPTLAPSVSPNPVLLNGNATASPNANDNLSGVDVASCAAIDTSSVGAKTVACTAADKAGNTASASAAYNVIFGFSSFSQPVDNLPTLNVANSGQAIPLKWRITDANGNPVTNLASVVVTAVSLSCPLGATPDQIEEYAAGASGLLNQGNGYYQFNWKTPKTYANSCKTMKLDLGEGPGMERTALFQFPK